jgi:hypothetical protein
VAAQWRGGRLNPQRLPQNSAAAALVEFLPPSLDGQLAVIDSHIQQAQAKIHYFGLRVLPVDTMLLQRQAQLRQQVDQAAIVALDIQKSHREAERVQWEDQTQYAEKLSQIDLQGTARETASAIDYWPY